MGGLMMGEHGCGVTLHGSIKYGVAMAWHAITPRRNITGRVPSTELRTGSLQAFTTSGWPAHAATRQGCNDGATAGPVRTTKQLRVVIGVTAEQS